MTPKGTPAPGKKQSQNESLREEIASRDMERIGEWELVEIVIESWNPYNRLLPKEKSVEPTTEIRERGRNFWRHSNGETYLTVGKNSYNGYDAVVYIGRPDEESVGPGWTCGIDRRAVSAEEAIKWAYEYMQKNESPPQSD